jgi:lipopolysaccharide export system protein LptA
MRTSVERLRIGLLAGAGLLVLVIAGFLGYARYRIHRAIGKLPERLGATITKEFNGYTYSQSDGKRTIFTIHASKATQHEDGQYSLHDVNMVLYGHTGDRADHISGSDFEYDTKEEVVRAIGVVHLDLEAPAPESGDARKHLASAPEADVGRGEAGPGKRVIHVKTSGLVYSKKLSTATTDEGIEFAFGGFTGHAVGAQYNSDTGHVVLQSAVTVSGVDRGKPVAMTASHGELDRATNLAAFTNARYSSAGEGARAELARIHMRADGSIERIEGEGQVGLEEAGQGSVTSDRGEVTESAASKPETAMLTGTVRFTDDEPLRQVRGESDRADLNFDADGRLDHAMLRGSVRTFERVRVADNAKEPWSERDLTADNLDLVLKVPDSAVKATGKAPDLSGETGSTREASAVRPILREATATGSARLTSVASSIKALSGTACNDETAETASRCAGVTTTKLSGDSLQAHFVSPRGVAELSTVHGSGHTSIEQINPEGVDQTSYGQSLDATFRESGPGKGQAELASAVQEGGVVMTRSAPVKSAAVAAEDMQRATGDRASFDADTDRLTLTGSVHVSDAGSILSAARVVMEQDTGDATADGGVKVSYLQAGSAQPAYVVAARAELNHDAGRATFYGRPAAGGASSNSRLARLWQPGADGQGGSQIEAPVLVFEQEQKRLTAKAETAGVVGQVHAALEDSGAGKGSGAAKQGAGVVKLAGTKGPTLTGSGVARIISSQMVYSDIDRQAVFTGGVQVFDGDGVMRSQQATVYLSPADAEKDKAAKGAAAAHGATTGSPGSSVNGLLGGNVERIVATQKIELTQPGRRATGDRLVYTASDQMFVLTGTAAAPPKVVDAQQGSTTGAVLRFHSGDNSVEVAAREGDDRDGKSGKVHTETRVKQ